MERNDMWNDIVNQAKTLNDVPLIFMGHFNETKRLNEKFGGSMKEDPYSKDSNVCCHNVELKNLRFIGKLFTWNNKSDKNGRILYKLD